MAFLPVPHSFAGALNLAALCSPLPILLFLGLAAYRDRTSAGSPRSAFGRSVDVNDWWWLVLLASAVLSVVSVTFGLVCLYVFDGQFALIKVVNALSTLQLVVQLASPVAYFLDYRRLRDAGVWEPSGVYYLSVVRGLGPIIAALYVYQRRRHLSEP